MFPPAAAAVRSAVALTALGEIGPASEPVAAFDALRAGEEPWLLESALRGERLGRFSFAGADPWLVLRAFGDRVEVECRRAAHPGVAPGRRQLRADPLEVVRALLPPPPEGAPEAFPFAGGAVGYLGYGLSERFEPLGLAHGGDPGLPDLVLLFVDRWLAWDHGAGTLCAVGLGMANDGETARARARDAARASAAALARHAPAPPRRVAAARRPPALSLDREGFLRAVAAIRREIEAGNVYQACLTHRLELDFAGDPWDVYRRLRSTSPAPFAAYLELPEVAVVGSSPERFLRAGPGGRAESRPIKGTRPRGRDAAQDLRLRRELAESAKERAENLMIVDLVRNDLGRVCATGSIEVPELMQVEAYASLFQLVSTVTGRLAPGRDALDLVRATFPPGSMTGAPKIAAMRLLDRLEPVRRGVYSGALGWLDARGGADLAVVIRTLLVREGRACVHAGAGIVADSDPSAEWRETLAKSRPLLEALAACGAPDAAALAAELAREEPGGQATWPPSIASAAPFTLRASSDAR